MNIYFLIPQSLKDQQNFISDKAYSFSLSLSPSISLSPSSSCLTTPLSFLSLHSLTVISCYGDTSMAFLVLLKRLEWEEGANFGVGPIVHIRGRRSEGWTEEGRSKMVRMEKERASAE